MGVRVNLMKATEYRRQGLVSTAFIIRASILTVALLALVFGALLLIQHRNARQQLHSARELWKTREPMYRQLQAMKQELATKRKLDRELEGWTTSRIEWAKLLPALQGIVPPSLQFRRLNVRGEMDIRLPKGKTAKAGAAAKPAADPAAPAPGGTPARLFFLLIEGRASGDKAEDAVLQFDAALRREPVFRALLQSVRLQRLQSEDMAASAAADRAFTIEASTARREMP